MSRVDLDRAIVRDYERFARSFTRIRAADIRSQVEAQYASDRFWPKPLIGINPHYERGSSISELAIEGTLHPETASVFRVNGVPITLFRHQVQAVAKAAAGQSFIVTTGTGSGKSLCFFIPIIDAAIRARAAGETRRTRAIVIYPMNALANSQLKELEKFIDQSGLADGLKPTFARYTGQESQEERERIREAKPDILLTNFMMLELLMTRQNPLDRAVISNSEGLEFLVLDELRDAAFDKGLISFDDDGVVLLGPTLSAAAQKSLAIDSVPRLEGLRDEHGANLSKHRSRHGFS